MSDTPPPRTVADALQRAQAAGIHRGDAQHLLAGLLRRPRTWLIAHGDAALGSEQAGQWVDWVARCAAGEPLAYLLGEQEFFGLSLRVGPQVLVPRSDTETLVEWGLDRLRALPDGRRHAPKVLDLGTGSGAIALALRHRFPAAEVWAVDASADALALARANGERLALPVHWQLGDWWSALRGLVFDLVLSNPPYIADGDPHLAALGHEPAMALSSGPDGLAALRRIVAGAPAHLQDGGWLLLEHGHDQAAAVGSLLRQACFSAVESRHDLPGHLRCTGGQWRP